VGVIESVGACVRYNEYMHSSRIVTIVTLALVVAFVTAVTLHFMETQATVAKESSREGVVRTGTTSFACGLLSEVSFSYPEFFGWRVTVGDSSVQDGRSSCVLQILAEDTKEPGNTSGVVLQKQYASANTMPPVEALMNPYGVPYVRTTNSLATTSEVSSYNEYVTFYVEAAEYTVRFIGPAAVHFPTSAFLEEVIATFNSK
jgi:hypothetical protein